ncbi:MAG: SixA phosphatase family protein [Nitrospiraceae bacterium]
MDCVLFRHGIAVDAEDWQGLDAQRPLTLKGVEKTRGAAGGLTRLDVAPTHVISSPFIRALDTAKIIREVFKIRDDSPPCEALLPDAPPDQLVAWLATLPGDASVVCVGHEPNLGQAAGFMLFGAGVWGLSLKKAGACAIRFDDMPKPGEGQLRWWMMPSQLRSMAKSDRGRRSKSDR